MSKQHELAAKLNCVQYEDVVSQDAIEFAKEHGLVIVTGAGDDLIEFDGVVNDEYQCVGSEKIWISENGDPIFGCEDPCDHCCNIRDAENARAIIGAFWQIFGYCWYLEINLPDEEVGHFDVLDGDTKYCRGIVFAVSDLRR